MMKEPEGTRMEATASSPYSLCTIVPSHLVPWGSVLVLPYVQPVPMVRPFPQA